MAQMCIREAAVLNKALKFMLSEMRELLYPASTFAQKGQEEGLRTKRADRAGPKYYGRSLEIWKDEAPEQPSLGDAKKSLALLEGS